MDQGDIRDLKVSDVMREEWPTLPRGATVEEAIKLFASEGISGAPVIEDGRIIGIITEGDLIFRDAKIEAPGFLEILGGMIPLGNWQEYQEETFKSAGVTVEQVMTDDVTTVAPDTSLSETATLMADRRMKLLPVTEGDTFRGVITRMDILTLHILNPSL
ncbi:MAG: CBS domain-containing protein [Rubrobacter sp.]